MKRSFHPKWWAFLLMLCCVALFIRLGLWQYGKAQQRLAMQAQLEESLSSPPVSLPVQIADLQSWRYRHVKVQGKYATQFQFFLDNQIEDGRAGYHVITPFVLVDTKQIVLINRGWIPVLEDRTKAPQVVTPDTELTLKGQVWLPNTKTFTLGQVEQSQHWQPLWQKMDLKAFKEISKLNIMPLAIKLDADSEGGGFSRNWPRPDERVTTNIGYAYQWFGFAVAACVIFLVTSFRTKDNK